MKTCAALLTIAACLRAEAMPACPVDGFYPTSGGGAGHIDRAVSDPKPKIVRDGEEWWFDFIEVDGKYERGWQKVYEVAVLRKDPGSFRVALLRAKKGATATEPGPGVLDSRDLSATVAERLHRGVIPILARTHYPAALAKEDSSVDRIVCTDGSWFYATVEEVDSEFDELVGEARPWKRDSDAGAVQALGNALHDYALNRIDERGLEEPLELVEAHAKPDNENPR